MEPIWEELYNEGGTCWTEAWSDLNINTTGLIFL